MFSHTTEYSLRAMACLASRPGDLTPTAALAREASVPPHYLAKVLQQLSVAGLVTGRRGVKGGYRLARDPADITLIDIVKAVGQTRGISAPVMGGGEHPAVLVALQEVLEQAVACITEIIGGRTLEDLLRSAESSVDGHSNGASHRKATKS